MQKKKDGKTKVEAYGIERKVLVNLPQVKKLLGGEKEKNEQNENSDIRNSGIVRSSYSINSVSGACNVLL